LPACGLMPLARVKQCHPRRASTGSGELNGKASNRHALLYVLMRAGYHHSRTTTGKHRCLSFG
jgi:hypothetical protein